ncbi:MAG: MtrB/PioB family outer membrane beta-barrel protein [Syntrophobacteraceae bacterium]
MKARLKGMVIGLSAGMMVFFAGHAAGAERVLGNRAGGSYAAAEYAESLDLLNGKFKPKRTVALDYCEVKIPSFKERVEIVSPGDGFGGASTVLSGGDTLFVAPNGRVGDCLERDWSSRSASGGSGKDTGLSGAAAEQGFYRRSHGQGTVVPVISGFNPSSEETSHYFQPAGGYDRPRFQFQFSFNSYASDYNVMQSFATVPSYTRNDRSPPNDPSLSYLGNSGSLFMLGQSLLNNTFSFGWRSGDNPASERYWGLSNTIEPEHPLFGYITEFKRPFNPLRFNTSIRSYDSHSTSDAATDLIRADRFPYLTKDVKVDAMWDMASPFSVNMGYRWQRWERDPEYWENASTDEHTQRVALKASPLSWLNVSTGYSQSFRSGSNYRLIEANPQDPEQILLPKFGLADRTRTGVDLTTELIPSKDMNIALTYGVSSDAYAKSIYNLIGGTSWAVGAALTWTPFSRLAFHVNYQHEEFSTRQASGIVAGDITRADDTLDTASAGMIYTLIPDRLSFVSRGSYSFSRSNYQVGDIPAGTGALARAESFVRVRCSDKFSFRCGYLYEDFGAGKGVIIFRDPLTGKSPFDYGAHVALAVINYEF